MDTQCLVLPRIVLLQKRHAWVFSMLEANPEGGNEYDVAEALPSFSAAAHQKSVADIKAWLKTLPLSRRQLCKVTTTGTLACCPIFLGNFQVGFVISETGMPQIVLRHSWMPEKLPAHVSCTLPHVVSRGGGQEVR